MCVFQVFQLCDEYSSKLVTYKLTNASLFKHIFRGFTMKLTCLTQICIYTVSRQHTKLF